MAYVVDRPNIQLDQADCDKIKAQLEQVVDSTHTGMFCQAGNVTLDAHDLLVLDVSADGGNTAVDTANLLLTAADVAAIAPYIT